MLDQDTNHDRSLAPTKKIAFSAGCSIVSSSMAKLTSYSEQQNEQAQRHRGPPLIRCRPAEGAGELVLHEVTL